MSEHEQKIQNASRRIRQQLSESYIRWNGLRVRLLDRMTTKTKTPIIFLHGWGSSSEVWFPVLFELFSENTPIVLVDLPGFGKSETPTDPFSINDYVSLMKKIYQEKKIESAILVGHSFGGQIATKVAVEEPAMVEKIVLVNSASVRNQKKSFFSYFASLLRPLFELPLLRSGKHFLLSKISGDDYTVNPAMYPTLKNVTNEDMTPVLSEVSQPTLIVWGEDDTVTPTDHAYILNENIPQALLVMLRDAGHYSFLDNPEKFTKTLLSFITHSR